MVRSGSGWKWFDLEKNVLHGYTNWDSGQPDGIYTCVVMAGTSSSKWSTHDCSTVAGGVACERQPELRTDSTNIALGATTHIIFDLDGSLAVDGKQDLDVSSCTNNALLETYYIIIDLGQDSSITQIGLFAKYPVRNTTVHFSTTCTDSEACWSKCIVAAQRRRTQWIETCAASFSNNARYIRLTFPDSQSISICEIIVLGASAAATTTTPTTTTTTTTSTTTSTTTTPTTTSTTTTPTTTSTTTTPTTTSTSTTPTTTSTTTTPTTTSTTTTPTTTSTSTTPTTTSTTTTPTTTSTTTTPSATSTTTATISSAATTTTSVTTIATGYSVISTTTSVPTTTTATAAAPTSIITTTPGTTTAVSTSSSTSTHTNAAHTTTTTMTPVSVSNSTSSSSSSTIFSSTTTSPAVITSDAVTTVQPDGQVLAWDSYGRAIRKKCTCRCKPPAVPQREEEAVERGDELKDELIVETELLSTEIAKKISKQDDRKSSNVIGFSGIAMLILPFVFIVIPDLLSLLKWLCRC